MSEGQRLALALMSRMNEVPHSKLPAGLSLLGVGQAEVMKALAGIELRTRQSAWSLHPRPTFDPEDVSYELEGRSRARGVDLQTIAPSRALRLNPLLTSLTPGVRIGPVLFKCIIVDRQAAVMAGPDTVEGDTTALLASGGDFLRLARELWDASLAESRPALEPGAARPLNLRQLDVARGVCLGKTDAAIARQLGISERTVARDVAAILDVTSARSRGEAILNMLGRGAHSRT